MMPSDGNCIQFLYIFVVVVVLGNDIVCIKIRQKEERNKKTQKKNVNKKDDTTLL